MNIPVRILGTGHVRPGRCVTTEEVALACVPPVDPQKAFEKTGIATRYWVEPVTTSTDIAVEAVNAALDSAGLQPEDIERFIFVSVSGGDWVIPATANMVAARLGMSGKAMCFDINNACAGFLTALDLSARAIATGAGRHVIVVSEVCSDFIVPEEYRPYLIFADAAAAVVLGAVPADTPADAPQEALLGVHLGNDGDNLEVTCLRHPRHSGRWHSIEFAVSSREIVAGSIAHIQESVGLALAQAGLTMADMDWVLPHQPNGRMLDRIIESIGADPARTVPVVQEIGSTSGASIPVSLDVLYKTRPVKPGDLVLLCTIGAGVSYGAAVLRVGDAPAGPFADPAAASGRGYWTDTGLRPDSGLRNERQ